MTSKVTDTNKTVEPELLGAELSEVLKNNPIDPVVLASDATVVDQVIPPEASANPDIPTEPVAPTPEVKTEETAPAQSEEIIADDSVSQVPKKEFSMPEQVNLVEEVVDAYISNPAIANSSR